MLRNAILGAAMLMGVTAMPAGTSRCASYSQAPA